VGSALAAGKDVQVQIVDSTSVLDSSAKLLDERKTIKKVRCQNKKMDLPLTRPSFCHR
jgi:hypothetical protein